MPDTVSAAGRYCGDFSIPRIEMPSVADFDQHYARIGKPVILTNLLQGTRAARLWTPDYLIQAIGSQKVTLTRLRNRKLRSNNARYTVPFADYARQAFASDPEAGKYCVQQIALPQAIAEDLPTPALVGSWLRVRPHLWLSTPGHVTETHRDAYHNLLVQVIGAKKLTLFSPIFTGALYSHRPGSPLARYSRVELDRLDLHRFPAARELVPAEITLQAGEALFLPVYWWHRVETVEVSVSVNFWWAPPLGLALHSQLPSSGTPEAIFQAIHALADLSEFPSEFDVVEDLWSEGFPFFAVAHLHHCLELLLGAARGPSDEELATITSILGTCQEAVARMANGHRGLPRRGMAEMPALVGEARRLAAKLGCADLFRPSRWVPDRLVEE